MSTTVARTPAQARADQIRSLYRESQRLWREACVLLVKAEQDRDWETLGFANFTEYVVQGLDIDQPDGSRMLDIGRIYAANMDEPMWERLPEHDQNQLSEDRMYWAMRHVRDHGEDPERMLHEAVAKSGHVLRDEFHGRESFTSHPCVCPACGAEHLTPAESIA